MQVCGSCGHPRAAGNRYCARCGTRFPDGKAASPQGSAPLEGAVPPAPGTRMPGRPGRPGRRAVFSLAFVLVAAAVGMASWFLTARSETSPPPPGPSAGPSGSPVPSGTDTGSTAPTGTASPSPSRVSPPPPGPVTIAPAASGNSAAQRITAFLDQYFDAINSHDYGAYTALLAPDEQAPSPSQFDSGYGSTTDTDETLRAISAGPDGEVVAHVTLTSHQDPSQSPTGTSCDTWAVSLYLVPDSGSYLIGKPPSSYRAGYKACS